MLASSGLCNNTLFANPFSKKNLTQRVIYFVRAGMKEVFPFNVYFWTV
jgi:hypothetical protein